MYARVVVNVLAWSGEFDYAIPPELAEEIRPGSLVTVPLGKQTVQGVVLELLDRPSVQETRSVLALLDPLPALTLAQLELARRLADSTLQPLAAFIDLMLPAGLSQHADTLYRLREEGAARLTADEGKIGARLLTLLRERGALRGRQIDRHFKHVDWRKTAQFLTRRGVLTTQPVLPPPAVRPKYVRAAQLAVPPEQAEAAMPTLGRTPSTLQRRQAALRVLMREADAVPVSWVYAESGCTLTDLQELAEHGLILLRETEIWRDPLHHIDGSALPGREPPPLTQEQQQVWEAIANAFTASHERSAPLRPFLLQGITGSGKTEIYLRAVQECLQRGQQAIILVPEIAITPQTIRRFLARFPGQVGLLHSRLSPGERYDTWRRARLGLLQVVVGPRSALFTPFPNPGLLIVDECHDASYYQAEPPFYHAIEAAKVYARLCNAVCILGSATPTIQQRYEAEVGKSICLQLQQRILHGRESRPVEASGLPPVQVVDMREELKGGNRHIFSRALQEALSEVLERNEQAILYLNRRGTATYVFCRECGYAAKCPYCDLPLTYHLPGKHVSTDSPRAQLRCHACGYARQMFQKCPTCRSQQIRHYGLGSEKVEAEVKALFPTARTLRWDWETTRQKEAHEIILGHFVAHRADVLIGTQMLAKGLDLPLVTLVGVVLAEVGLNLPDPFAAERAFSLLTQVAGRAGRSDRGGQVILQTFQPQHYVVQCAARHDVDGFYTRELRERRRLGYPPFAHLARLEYRHTDPHKAEAEAQRMADRIRTELRERHLALDLIGPAPCFFARLGGQYRWQIVLRGADPLALLRGKPFPSWRVEIDPPSLL